MGRPDPRRPRAGQTDLFEDVAIAKPDKVLRGRHSEAMDRALDAARDQGAISEVDDGLATVLRAGAWSLDAFEKQNKPYGPSKIIDAMVAALTAANMTPGARAEATDDSIKELLNELAISAPGDAEVPHETDAR